MKKHVFEGLNVIDFGWVFVAPLMAKCLADFGATVVRIESETRPDSLRTVAPYKDGIPGINRSGAWTMVNSNKYELALNLTHPRGQEVAKRLVTWADIVIEGYRAGTMAKWGLGYESLKKVKPDIIMISTCNQGQTGPRAQFAGFGTQLTSLAGFVALTGWPDKPPSVPYGGLTDMITPRFGVVSLIAALDYRRRTGKGLYIDISQYESSLQFLTAPILDFTVNNRVATRKGNECSYAAPHGAYRCKGEDQWCVIAVFTDEEWRRFGKAIGKPAWVKDARFSSLSKRKKNEEELNKHVEEWTIGLTAREVMETMQGAGISAGIVQTGEQVQKDVQLQHRHYFWQLEHPEIGRHNYNGQAFKLSKTDQEVRLPGPLFGQHTEYVCTKLLGMSDAEFTELLAAGVLR